MSCHLCEVDQWLAQGPSASHVAERDLNLVLFIQPFLYPNEALKANFCRWFCLNCSPGQFFRNRTARSTCRLGAASLLLHYVSGHVEATLWELLSWVRTLLVSKMEQARKCCVWMLKIVTGQPGTRWAPSRSIYQIAVRSDSGGLLWVVFVKEPGYSKTDALLSTLLKL